MRTFNSLSWRNIRSRPLRAGLNAIGIVLGVGLVFAVTALSANLVRTFDNLFDSVYGNTDIVVTTANGGGILPGGTIERVKATDGVEQATGVISSIMTLVKDGRASRKAADRIFAAGSDPRLGNPTGAKLVAGRALQPADEGMVIDKTFADKQGIVVGDSVPVAAAAGLRTLEVVGIERYKGDFSFGGQGLARLPLAAARDVFAQPKGYNEIDIRVSGDVSTIDDVKQRLEDEFGAGVQVSTPKDLGEQIGNAIKAFRVVLGFFAGIAVFVGGFLILNSFSMTIAQRIREIGMLRTMGAGRRQVTRSILTESIVLGVVGSVVGLGVGLLLMWGLIAMIRTFGLQFSGVYYPPSAFILAVLIGVLATIVAAWQPARRAGRASPMEAVREESATERPRIGRRTVFGVPMMLTGLLLTYAMVTSTDPSTLLVVAGIAGVFGLFTGAILMAPLLIRPIALVLAPVLRLGGRLEGRIAVDNVLANTRRSAATASILMVGIAMVATFGSIASSSIATLNKQLDAAFKSDFNVTPVGAGQGGGPQATMSPAVARALASTPGVAVVSPERTMFLTDGLDGVSTIVTAVDPATAAQVKAPDFVGATVQEAFDGLAAGGAILAQDYADRRGIDVGETITLAGLTGTKSVRVVALDPTSQQAEAGLTLSLATARDVYGLNQDSSIGITLDDGADTERVREALEAKLKAYPQVELKSTAEIKDDIERQQSQGLVFFYALMFVAILIGLFGVMNTMFISVIERTREVGVLRAIGARRRQVRKVVRRESILLAVAGTLMGLAVGLVLGYVFVYAFNRNTEGSVYAPPVGIIVLSAVLSVIFGVLAAGLPARRAARINVVEAVSFE